MKYFEILEPFKNNRARCFIDGEIQDTSKEQLNSISSRENFCTYKYHRDLKNISENILVADLMPKSLEIKSLDVLKEANSKIEPFLKSLVISKIDVNLPWVDLVPERVLVDFYTARQKAVSIFLDSYPRIPQKEYRHFLQVENLIDEISRQPVLVDSGKIRSEKQLKIVRSGFARVKYDSKKTVTGRLSTRRSSFPIMTLGALDRSFITPTNDFFIELDYNAAEVRTLLYFSGKSQPSEDIHEWNAQNIWKKGGLRQKAKEKFFAWLYNPKSSMPELEEHYNRNAHISHYEGGIISTPFGRRIKVDKDRALNYLLQSTSSDINLEQSVKVADLLRGKKTFVKFLMHDSLVLDVSREDLKIMHKVYETFCTTRLGKFVVNVNHGSDYGKMRSLEWKI